MRWFIDWILSLVCEHEWECLMNEKCIKDYFGDVKYYQWIYRCKKCGKKNVIKSK